MTTHNAINEPSIPMQDEKNLLEKKKLELEIKQLEYSFFKKKILPILIQAMIGVFIAILSIYLAFKSNIFDVREKNIDAKTKYNETLLKTIEIIQKKDELSKDLKIFEGQKIKLLNDSVKLSRTIDSMETNLTFLAEEKSMLLSNINNLNKDKNLLEDRLGFASIQKNLEMLKKYPNPNYTFIEEILNSIKNKNKYSQRIIDSLNNYLKMDYLTDISYFLLFKGTGEVKYREQLFSRIPTTIDNLKPDTTDGGEYRTTYDTITQHDTIISRVIITDTIYHWCMDRNYIDLLSDELWNNEEKAQIIDILLDNCNDKTSPCVKGSILYTIGKFGYDSTFSFSKTDYDSYWTYLQKNRDLFMSHDTMIDRYTCFTNIGMFCPFLYFALIIKCYSYEDDFSDVATNQCLFAITKSLTSWEVLPYWREQFLVDLSTKNDFVGKPKSFYKDYYAKHKAIIDTWLYGDFDRFRNKNDEFEKCIQNLSF